MKNNLYVIYDRKAMESSHPVACKNDAVACRMFQRELERSRLDNDDLRLYLVGCFDNETMKMEEMLMPREIYSASANREPEVT